MNRPRYPLARLSPAKQELLVLSISRESVIAGDILPVREELAPLAATREAAMHWEGALTFYFEGWDDDPRETAEIPEIRVYFQALTEAWPYWLHFVEKVGDTFGHVLRLLCRGHVEPGEGGMIAWRFDEIGEITQQVMRLFDGMNELHERLELPEAMNERISQEIGQLLEGSLQ